MALAFPNPSRSFDEERNAVQFIGYDGMFQVSFFVEARALMKASAQSPRASALEKDYLLFFDQSRKAIYEAAHKAYASRRQGSYTLTADNFNG